MDRLKVASELIKMAKSLVAAGFKMERSFFIPRNDPTLEKIRVPSGVDLEIYRYEGAKGGIYGMAFQGKANKPLWHYKFHSERDFEKAVRETIESRQSYLKSKSERQEERRKYRHDLKEGDILSGMWGYDQTNVEFYEVTGVLSKSVVVRELAQRVVKEEAASERVVPVPGKYIGPPLKKRVSPGGMVKIDSSVRVSRWSGKPLSQTAPGFGH